MRSIWTQQVIENQFKITINWAKEVDNQTIPKLNVKNIIPSTRAAKFSINLYEKKIYIQEYK